MHFDGRLVAACLAIVIVAPQLTGAVQTFEEGFAAAAVSAQVGCGARQLETWISPYTGTDVDPVH